MKWKMFVFADFSHLRADTKGCYKFHKPPGVSISFFGALQLNFYILGLVRKKAGKKERKKEQNDILKIQPQKPHFTL